MRETYYESRKKLCSLLMTRNEASLSPPDSLHGAWQLATNAHAMEALRHRPHPRSALRADLRTDDKSIVPAQ